MIKSCTLYETVARLCSVIATANGENVHFCLFMKNLLRRLLAVAVYLQVMDQKSFDKQHLSAVVEMLADGDNN